MMMSKMIASRSLHRIVAKAVGGTERIVAVRSFGTDAFSKKVRSELVNDMSSLKILLFACFSTLLVPFYWMVDRKK